MELIWCCLLEEESVQARRALLRAAGAGGRGIFDTQTVFW